MYCCDVTYHEPLTGNKPLHTKYLGTDKKITFSTTGKKNIRSYGNGKTDITTNFAAWEKYIMEAVDAKKGLYRIKTHHNKYWQCDNNNNKLNSGSTLPKQDMRTQFQFFMDNDELVIYHPLTQAFVQTKGDLVMCDQDVSFEDATHWGGIKMPLPDITAHVMYPELFRTKMTRDGEGNGWGYQTDALSPWFTFYEEKSGKWLKANNNK